MLLIKQEKALGNLPQRKKTKQNFHFNTFTMKKFINKLSVKGKILLIIAINILFLLVVFLTTVFLGMRKTATINLRIANTSKVGSLQQTSDMMHDALRADLFKTLLVDSGNVAAYKAVFAELTEHKGIFISSVKKGKELELEPEIAEQLNNIEAPLLNYISITEELSKDAASGKFIYNSEEGKARLDEFNVVFDLLAVEMEALTDVINKKSDELQVKANESIVDLAFFLFVVMIITISVTVFISLQIIKYITVPIVITENILAKLTSGEIIENVEVEGTDETARMLTSLNGMVTNLNNVKEFVTEVGNGNFNTDISVFDNKGDIYESLNKMKDDLKNTAEEDKKRNWATEGMAKFGDILRANNDNISVLSDQIIGNLVKYLNANQGGLFIVNDTNPTQKHLELIACYAWNKKKYLNMQIQVGEGLVGQAWQENDLIYVTDVPENFIKITSGLGDANPSSFIIVPLTVNDITFGVVEIASFNKFEDHQIEFVKKIAENIASTLSTAKINERTKILLEQSQQQAEEMRAQEEEMRQNMEEMHATQEEMQRKESEMFAIIEDLKKNKK